MHGNANIKKRNC